jgi:alkylhydroperoxidase/carboxymuconolactone decarboxylase family protein YurZ
VSHFTAAIAPESEHPRWGTDKRTIKEVDLPDTEELMSNAFRVFISEAPKHAQAWMTVAKSLDEASALDKKTESLAYLSVLAALGLESGIPFHVIHAKDAGASREEVISAVLVGLPAAGNIVTRSLPAAIKAYDSP